MRKNIEQALAAFSDEEQRQMRDLITALDNGKVHSAEFYPDGSGVSFAYYPPTIKYGYPGIVFLSLRMEQAIIVLAGHRLRSNRASPICF